MAERPRDIALNDDADVFLDDANDLALVAGDAQLEQSIAIDVLDVTQQFVGDRISAQTIGLLEQRIREGLEEDPQVGIIRDVSVESFDKRDRTVTVDVSLAENPNFTIELSA
jgi:hypothetical protein